MKSLYLYICIHCIARRIHKFMNDFNPIITESMHSRSAAKSLHAVVHFTALRALSGVFCLDTSC